MLLAITFAIQKSHEAEIYKAGFPALTIFDTALSSAGAKAVILISTVGQLFCGVACVTSASRMTFAFSRDGAVPGPQPVAAPEQEQDADLGGVVRGACSRSIVTIPAYFPNHLGEPVAFLAVTSISVIGLYIAYTIPVFLRWRMGDASCRARGRSARSTSGSTRSRSCGSRICVVIFCLPFAPEGGSWESALQLVGGQLRADGDDRDDRRP